MWRYVNDMAQALINKESYSLTKTLLPLEVRFRSHDISMFCIEKCKQLKCWLPRQLIFFINPKCVYTSVTTHSMRCLIMYSLPYINQTHMTHILAFRIRTAYYPVLMRQKISNMFISMFRQKHRLSNRKNTSK